MRVLWPPPTLLVLLGSFLIAFLFDHVATGFSISREGLPGIWKLYLSDGIYPLVPPQTEEDLFRARLLAQEQEGNSKALEQLNDGDEILLKLNPDGTFRQCSEGYREGCWISGRWKLKSGGKLLLAFDRQYYGPRSDLLLQGSLWHPPSEGFTSENRTLDSTLSFVGDVFAGKFCYPKQHPAFFDEPIALSMKNQTGNFSLIRAVAAFSVQPSAALPKNTTANDNDDSVTPFQKSDFYGRKFFMTIEPLILKRSLSKEDAEIRRNLPVDIRAMPIKFYRNNTFQAFGMNKILRGRFDILTPNENRDMFELWFQVSLFGAGRSAPGSVYSEGLGLTHHDKRSYVGEILKTAMPNGGMKLFVSGSVTFGSELGPDARSEPVAIFQLVETSDDMLPALTDDGHDGLNSIFQ